MTDTDVIGLKSMFHKYYSEKCQFCRRHDICYGALGTNAADMVTLHEPSQFGRRFKMLAEFLRQQQILCAMCSFYKPKPEYDRYGN